VNEPLFLVAEHIGKKSLSDLTYPLSHRKIAVSFSFDFWVVNNHGIFDTALSQCCQCNIVFVNIDTNNRNPICCCFRVDLGSLVCDGDVQFFTSVLTNCFSDADLAVTIVDCLYE
jgi:hypothetical protein